MMIPTLFSVSYAGLWGQHALDLKSTIARAAELGYSAVELMGKRPHLSILDATDRQLAEVREAAAQSGNGGPPRTFLGRQPDKEPSP